MHTDEVEAVARAIWLSARPARTGQWRHARGQDECRAMARAAIAAMDRARAEAERVQPGHWSDCSIYNELPGRCDCGMVGEREVGGWLVRPVGRFKGA